MGEWLMAEARISLHPVCITDCHGLKDFTEPEGARLFRHPCNPVIRLIRDSDLLPHLVWITVYVMCRLHFASSASRTCSL